MDDDIDIVAAASLHELGSEASRNASLARVRRGYYAPAEQLDVARMEARYRARISAVARARTNPIFALESALALHRIPFGSEPAYLFTAGDPSTPGARSDVRSSHLRIPDEFVTEVDGCRCSTIAWTLADIARRRLPSDSVSAIDAALHAGLTTKEAIEHALSYQSKQHRARARWSIDFSDAASESVGESRSRVAIVLLGFPRPELQVPTETSRGTKWSDFGWQIDGRWLLGEFDGLVKYGELAARAGKQGAEALVEEKQREDAIRRTGRGVVRWIWGDVLQPYRLEQVLLEAGLPQSAPIVPKGVSLFGGRREVRLAQ